jgi:hypothetical protein
MWIAHFRLSHGEGSIALFGTVNIVSSTVHFHLFDSAHGWLYVFGVGVPGGVAAAMTPKSGIQIPGSTQFGITSRSQN